MQTPKNVSVEPSMVVSKTKNQQLSCGLRDKNWTDSLKSSNKIQRMETCKITHYAASVHGQNGLVCVHDDEQELFLSQNHTLPQIANRLWGEACCCTATSDWTSRNECIVSETGYADETTVYINRPSFTANSVTAQSLVIKQQYYIQLYKTLKTSILWYSSEGWTLSLTA
jgi:hypothetical protein